MISNYTNYNFNVVQYNFAHKISRTEANIVIIFSTDTSQTWELTGKTLTEYLVILGSATLPWAAAW